MSKLTQIQNELRAINPAKFQQLSDLYLHKKGHANINPIGSMIGADKVAVGTPDSLIKLPNGKYLFAEYTTQQEGVATKFKGDLAKCFDESKTGIPVSEIEQIILCHTTILSTKDVHELGQLCQKHGCILTEFGIGAISFDLYQLYPGLAKDFLGVEIDTHQILPPEDFVKTYNKNAFATPLDTTFQFREEEVKNTVGALTHYDLVIIAGKAGVGKSRLALESCDSFVKENNQWKIWCIYNRGQNIYEDLQTYFSPDGHYLILVDDANRINFDYVLQLLHEQTNTRKIKIIATVRDYALEKVRSISKLYSGSHEIEIERFTDEQIAQLVSAQHNINNSFYLERITSIATGNPRLAMMAAKIAITENTLQSIRDVSQLYDQYFRSIRDDLTSLSDHNAIQVAGIIAFFRTVDRSNDEMMRLITSAFGISEINFWTAAQMLHELEVVDMHENEVVKVSDQVLSTYVFYLAVFRESLLSFDDILTHFFPRFSYRIVDVLNSVLNSFEASGIISKLRSQITPYRKNLQKAGNISDLLEFLRVFWFTDQTQTLRILRDIVEDLEEDTIELSEQLFLPDRQKQPGAILRILSQFRYTETSILVTALDLLWKYAEKQLSELPVILRIIESNFGFTHRSSLYDYSVERELILSLKRRVEGSTFPIYPQLFCALAKYFLRVSFHYDEAVGHHAIRIYNFQLSSSPSVLAIREIIWKELFALYENFEFRELVLETIQTYISTNGEHYEVDIIKNDATHLLPFMEQELKPQIYAHCILVRDYIRLLEWRKVHFDKQIQQKFVHETVELATLFGDDRREMVQEGHENYITKKRARLLHYCRDFELSDYKNLIIQCEEIALSHSQRTNSWDFEQNITSILASLANVNAETYAGVISYLLERKNKLQLHPVFVVSQLVTTLGFDKAWDILANHDFPEQHWWLFTYFTLLPEDKIKPIHAIRLALLYREAQSSYIPIDLHYLSKFHFLNKNFTTLVIKVLLNRVEENEQFGFVFERIFGRHDFSNPSLSQIFISELDLLKQSYFAAHLIDEYPDYSGKGLNFILNEDKTFLRDYFLWLLKNNKIQTYRQNARNYDFLWLREDCESILFDFIEFITGIEEYNQFFATKLLEEFFIKHEGRHNSDIELRQENFLKSLITLHCHNLSIMCMAFDIIVQFGYERREQFLVAFIACNRSFTDFKELSLESGFSSWSGSMVPLLERRLAYYQSLVKLFPGIDLIEHRQYIEENIQRLREQIEQEKKQDFMEI